jgi:anti-sigma factor (TIGR02949 family)
MADCEETLNELEPFLDGEMSPEHLDHVRQHLEGCMDCYQAFDFYVELKAVIRERCREQELPPGLADRVRACFGDDTVET